MCVLGSQESTSRRAWNTSSLSTSAASTVYPCSSISARRAALALATAAPHPMMTRLVKMTTVSCLSPTRWRRFSWDESNLDLRSLPQSLSLFFHEISPPPPFTFETVAMHVSTLQLFSIVRFLLTILLLYNVANIYACLLVAELLSEIVIGH